MPLLKLKELFEAARQNNAEEIKKFVDAGGSVNSKDENGRSLLRLVMEQPEFDEGLATYLIEQGADLSEHMATEDEYYLKTSILHLAYLNLKNPAHSVLFNALLARADVDVHARYDEGFAEAQHFSVRVHPDGYLSSYPDAANLEQATLFHAAVIKNDLVMVRKLHGLGKLMVNQSLWLVENKHLLCNYDDKDSGRFGPILTMDAENLAGDQGLLVSVWGCRTSLYVARVKNVTPLHLAARYGYEEMADLLLELGADPAAKDSNQKIPLDYLKKTKEDKKVRESFAAEISDDAIDHLTAKFDAVLQRQSRRPTYKRHLIIGDGDFSYSDSFLRKRRANGQELGSVIIATEYAGAETLKETHGDTFSARIHALQEQGVAVHFGIDATKLTTYSSLFGTPRQRLKRIHFNFPHDKSNFKDRTLPRLLKEFFKNAAMLQQERDKILIVLPKGSNADKRRFYQSYVYGIYQASAEAGYALEKKRLFNSGRYPGYKHMITGRSDSAAVAEDGYEYIFIKTSLSYEQILADKRYKPGGSKYAYNEKNYYLQELETDGASSGYEDSDEDNIAQIQNT